MSSNPNSPRPVAWPLLNADEQVSPSGTPIIPVNESVDVVDSSPVTPRAPSHSSTQAASHDSPQASKSVEDYGLFRKSFRALSKASLAMVADDPNVKDKWQVSATDGSRAWSSSGFEIDRELKGAGSLDHSPSTLMKTISVNTKPTMLIAKQYWQGLMYSMLTAAINIPLVYGLSRIKWHDDHPGQQPAFTLNQKTYELSLIFQCVFPLSLYAIILYACIKSTWRLPKALVAFNGVLVLVAIMVAILFWVYDVPFWFYSGDFIYIALSYVPAMCAVGWFLAEEGSTNKERFNDLMMVALLETVVAASALLYCMYLMPLFFMLSAWPQLAWMCILHPVYFEITTAFLLRWVLRHNALKGRTNVQWFLSIVHASVHSVSISCILTSSIDSFGVTILTQVLCSACKLMWRSTTNWRDLWAERLGKRDFKFNYPLEEKAVQNRMVAVGIQTEMILENASNVLAPWLIWCTWHEPLFMSMAPDFLVQGGSYPAHYVILLIFTLVVVTATFDLAFLFLNYHGWQQLPVIQTWREIRKAGWWYFGFLTYALTFMGFMFLFITMILVPRAVFCSSNNYCDCRLPTLQGVCDGDFVSTWGGNII